MLIYRNKTFIWQGVYADRHLPKDAGFLWDNAAKHWYTNSVWKAYALRYHIARSDETTRAMLMPIYRNIQASSATDGETSGDLYPFQYLGACFAARQLQNGRKAMAIFDEQGLGKTVEAIEVANIMGLKKLLVVCPASLRLNWERELYDWHVNNPGVRIFLSGRDKFDSELSVVTSYELAANTRGYNPDMVIIDESHKLKNPGTIRTKLVLGTGKKWRGLVAKAPTVFLSGTPLPNGKPDELFPILRRCASDVISCMGYTQYAQRFCRLADDGYTTKVVGSKNEKELFTRLRGSGFMVRRLKKDVLKELPPKRFKLVVFPVRGATRKVLNKEKQFNVKEIMKHGVPVGSPLPEIRREMGIAKVPQCVEYIKDMLEGGTKKIIVFGHHRDVIFMLRDALERYNPAVILGGSSALRKQEMVDKFQDNPSCRVFIGNEAAEEGITLTASHDVVLAEPEWVPGKNEQRQDRAHRIGQLERVIVHTLVVQGSLDAIILGASFNKAKDVLNVLDRNL